MKKIKLILPAYLNTVVLLSAIFIGCILSSPSQIPIWERNNLQNFSFSKQSFPPPLVPKRSLGARGKIPQCSPRKGLTRLKGRSNS